MRRRFSRTQIVCIALLWAALCYLILTHTERIDGTVIATLLISAGFVFVPIIQSLKGRNDKN